LAGVIVTEYGSADLRGLTVKERAAALTGSPIRSSETNSLQRLSC